MRLTLPVCYCQDANLRRMVFRLKVSEETYQDERRVKCNIFKMDRPDYAKECKVRQPHGIWLTGFASACLACLRQVRATCEQPFMPSEEVCGHNADPCFHNIPMLSSRWTTSTSWRLDSRCCWPRCLMQGSPRPAATPSCSPQCSPVPSSSAGRAAAGRVHLVGHGWAVGAVGMAPPLASLPLATSPALRHAWPPPCPMVARPPRAQVALVGMAVALAGPMGVLLGGVAAMVLEAVGLVALVALGVLGAGGSKVVRPGVPMAGLPRAVMVGLLLRVDMEGLRQPQVEPHTVAHQEGAMGAPRLLGVAGAGRPLSNRVPQGAMVARHSSSSSPSHSGDR